MVWGNVGLIVAACQHMSTLTAVILERIYQSSSSSTTQWLLQMASRLRHIALTGAPAKTNLPNELKKRREINNSNLTRRSTQTPKFLSCKKTWDVYEGKVGQSPKASATNKHCKKLS